jgi:TPR repeat protein
VPRNLARSAELYDKACAAKQWEACTNLGMLYEKGSGVAPSPMRAAELFETGCAGGNGMGCWDLARYYAKGFGVARDELKADELYRKACELDGHLCDRRRP